MRFSLSSVLVAVLAADTVAASSWFGSTVYNKWHETELERWLSDHNVPYPTPADRKDLEDLIKNHWNDKVVAPYNSWETPQLQKYLTARGQQAKKGAEKNKDSLLEQIKVGWSDTTDSVDKSYTSVKDWIFDSWTDSQLKAFADRNGIPVPQPRTRDSLLKTVRENYQSAANALSETAAYPGNWLYESWSESDLKAWLDERGIPIPQPTKRDELIASVRRNSRIASNNLASWSSSLSASAAAATESLSDALFEKYSDSELKKWADEKGLNIPQGSKRNEVLAVIRRHRAQVNSEGARLSSSAASAYGAASSSAGNEYAQATEDAQLKFENVQSAFLSYIDWAKSQVGLASATASASGSSASKAASKSAFSASKSAALQYSKASSAAASVTDKASKDASKTALAASKSAASLYSRASSAAESAASKAKQEL